MADKHQIIPMPESEQNSSFNATETNQSISKIGHWEMAAQSGKCIFSSEIFDIYGLDPLNAPASYDKLLELICEEDRQKVIDTHQGSQINLQDQYQSLHRINRASDGQMRYLLERCEHKRDSRGKVISTIGVVQDITERIKAQQAYARIFDLSTDLICIADINTATFININPAFTKVLGYSPEELLNRPFLDLIHPDDVQSTVDIIKDRLIKGNTVINFENRYRCKNGTYKLLKWNAHPIPDEGLTYSIAHDITENRKAEEKLKLSEQTLQMALDAVSDGIWEWNIQTGETILNDRSLEMFGFDPAKDSPTAEETFAKIVPEDLPKVKQSLQNHIDEKTSVYRHEFRIRHVDGTVRWILGRGRIIEWDNAGNPIRIIGTNTDITEQIEATTKLKDSEFKYRALYDNAPTPYQSLNSDGTIKDVNPTWLHTLGYEREEVIGKWFGNFLAPEMVDAFRERFPLFKKTGRISDVQFKMRHKDGRFIYVSFDGRMGYYPNGSVSQSYCVFKDITDQKKAEMELAERQRQLTELMNNMPGMAYRCSNDTDYTLYFVSPGVKELTGYTPEEITGGKLDFAELIVPQDKQYVWDTIQHSIQNREAYVLEYRIEARDGQTKWVWERGAAVFDKNGQVEALEGIIVDITERKHLASQLLQAQKMEAIGRLAGGVAHDFNNMLQAILGYTDMILDRKDCNLKCKDDLEQIHKAASRSANLTKQLLAFARKQNINPVQTDLNHTITPMLDMLKPLVGENIDLVWKPEADIWPVKIDPSQIDQILANLIVNARDAIDKTGVITIETSNISIRKQYLHEHANSSVGDFVVISVSDNGCGMDKHTVSQIFEPFFTTKQCDEGTGLGLATVYGIVQQNYGFINVYSEPDIGTTFRIYLPKHSAETKEVIEPTEPHYIATGSESIMYVEDEPALLKLGSQLIKQLGYNVVSASSPEEAVKLFREDKKIDLLISDVIMPQMSGVDLSNELKAIQPDLKCLFVSGYTASIVTQKQLLPEHTPFMQKPFTKQALAHTIREILDN